MPYETENTKTGPGALALFEMPGAEKLLEEHRDLVLRLARRHARFGMSAEDLVSEGNLGLLRAASKFNPGREVKFSTYASHWVRQAMLRALDNKSRTVRLPWQSTAKLKRLREVKDSFAREHGREASETEISAASGLSLRTLRNLSGSCAKGVSLDSAPDINDSGKSKSLMDSIPDPSRRPDEELANKDSRELFLRALSTLDSREARIIRLRFGLGDKKGAYATCEKVGAMIGLSREGVRKIQERSLSKLRAILLPEYGDFANDTIAV